MSPSRSTVIVEGGLWQRLTFSYLATWPPLDDAGDLTGLDETTSLKYADKNPIYTLYRSDGPRQDMHVEPPTKSHGLPEKRAA